MAEKTEPIEPEVVTEQKEQQPKQGDLAKPGTPVSVDDLALLEIGRGEQIVLQRAQILATSRAASIRQTEPNDWTLFKTESGQEYGYLGDQGCQRIKRIWGIQLSNLGPLPNDPYYEFREGKEETEYSCRMTGDGYCELTKEHFFALEGVRYSDDPSALQQPAGQRRRDHVATITRRNLEGRLTRRAGGLEAVPVEELAKNWEGTWKKIAMCNHGRGYGSRAERMGAQVQQSDELRPGEEPICEQCEKA